MKKIRVKLIAAILIIATLFSFSSHLYAAEGKKYLSDIRLVMAESFEKAQKELASSIYSSYTLYPYNLNDGNSKYFGITDVDMGVYIAYTTTDNVDEAITDIAVMDMNGGYNEGNMQAALQTSMKQYIKLAEKYLTVIDYMLEGVEAGNYLSNAALRQFNIYHDPIAKKNVGDMLLEGISAQALASMLLKANTTVVSNFRSLMAMGASYNEDGKTYLDKVKETAEAYNADPTVYDSENWYETAVMIEGTLGVLRDLISDYRYVEDELDYSTGEWGEKEFEYLEAATIAIHFESVPYINGKNLADFIVEYEMGGDNYKKLYPLVAALNPGQKALAELCQFYDVVRYESTLLTEEIMDEKIAELEAEWPDGCNIYMGVDLAVYDSTFAVTTEADRSSASSGRDITGEVLLRNNAIISYFVNALAMFANVSIYTCRVMVAKSINADLATQLANARAAVDDMQSSYREIVKSLSTLKPDPNAINMTNHQLINTLAGHYDIKIPNGDFYENLQYLLNNIDTTKVQNDGTFTQMYDLLKNTEQQLNAAKGQVDNAVEAARQAAQNHADKSVSFTGMTLTFSGVMLCITAYQIGTWVYNYYNPEFSDIPADMVDVVSTVNGDRFIHYRAAENIKPNKDGEYKPVCLNAFEGSRWIALYYTKSYEAGNALLPEFNISERSNVAKKGFISVGKFGEENCYDLNSHAFKATKTVYMSVAVSDDAKTFATDVPTVVGSFIGTGGYFIAAAAGAGLTVGFIAIRERARKKKASEPKAEQ